MKKTICFTFIYHVLFFVLMIIGQITKNGGMVNLAWMADMGGTFILPLAIAVTAMITGMRDEQRVIRLFPNSVAAVGVIGLVRAALFLFFGGANGFKAAMMYLLISFLLLTLWFLIFEISSSLMNKSTKINNRFGGKNNKRR